MKKLFFAVCILVSLLFGILHITIGDQNSNNARVEADLHEYENNSIARNEELARKGDSSATYYLSLVYLQGISVAKDDTKAEYWLKNLGVNTKR
jgi:TPR repeat protein